MVISRDHHDVSGTDSPFRETSNVYDGSAFCAGLCFSFSLNLRFETQNIKSSQLLLFDGDISNIRI